MVSVVICGARCSKQGIGEYVTKYLHQTGVNIVGIVATTIPTGDKALQNLQKKYGISCNVYQDLEKAILKENPDLVVICSPYHTHYKLLQIVLEHKKHCLCEKPLVWNEKKEIFDLVNGFLKNKCFLDTITQWPYTLKYFHQLYPSKKEDITSFDMMMSPISCGREMILDSIPHLLSMLYSLVGAGEIKKIEHSYHDLENTNLIIKFEYCHKYTTKVKCVLCQTKKQPRPVAYSINNNEVKRSIDMNQYQMSLENKNSKIKIDDPLKCLIEDYIFRLENNVNTNKEKLLNNINQLHILYEMCK